MDKNERPVAVGLHLELSTENCTDKDMNILREYGKIKNGISRDIIAPADMTLTALHYAIQKLFGWQDCHLHSFEFPDPVFDRLTGGSFARWCRLAGVYFRYPDEEDGGTYFDDGDDEEDVDIGAYLKSRYTGPYERDGIDDCYLECQSRVRRLKEANPAFRVAPSFREFMANGGKELIPRIVSIENATVDEFGRSAGLSEGLGCLIESLTPLDCLILRGEQPHDIENELGILEYGLDHKFDRWDTARAGAGEDDGLLRALAESAVLRMRPQSETLNYSYDYGDDWAVTISMTKVYYESDLAGRSFADLRSVAENCAPVCVAADGLSVFDDVGGVTGYVDFLRSLHSDDAAERRYARDRARYFGWTARAVKPQNRL